MKIILIGSNGRMGQEICKEAFIFGDEIVLKVDKNDVIKRVDADVIIDFSTSQDREKYIEYSRQNKIPYCCFATGMSEKDKKLFQELSNIAKVLLCSNASLGMNLIFKIVDKMCKDLKNADIVLTEYHHKNKKDTPSGTAKKLQNIINGNGKCVQIGAFRVGNEFGTHKIQFFLDEEMIEITHKAYSRKVFALGALSMVREFLQSEEMYVVK